MAIAAVATPLLAGAWLGPRRADKSTDFDTTPSRRRAEYVPEPTAPAGGCGLTIRGPPVLDARFDASLQSGNRAESGQVQEFCARPVETPTAALRVRLRCE